MEIKQENVDFLLGLALLMSEHCSYKKDVWTEFINGIEGMNVIYTLELGSRA